MITRLICVYNYKQFYILFAFVNFYNTAVIFNFDNPNLFKITVFQLFFDYRLGGQRKSILRRVIVSMLFRQQNGWIWLGFYGI